MSTYPGILRGSDDHQFLHLSLNVPQRKQNYFTNLTVREESEDIDPFFLFEQLF
jgi:hypothetical protein